MKFLSLIDAANQFAAVPVRSVVKIEAPWCLTINGRQITPSRYPLLYRVGGKIQRGATDAAALIAAGLPLPS